MKKVSFFCRDMIAIKLRRHGEALAAGRFGGLAVQQRDLLGILAHAHQAEAEIGLEALLLEVQRDQRAADQCVSGVPMIE